jgi:hypothetical protein
MPRPRPGVRRRPLTSPKGRPAATAAASPSMHTSHAGHACCQLKHNHIHTPSCRHAQARSQAAPPDVSRGWPAAVTAAAGTRAAAERVGQSRGGQGGEAAAGHGCQGVRGAGGRGGKAVDMGAIIAMYCLMCVPPVNRYVADVLQFRGGKGWHVSRHVNTPCERLGV